MFAKLLKHEWRSSRRTIGTLCAIILISGLLIGSVTLGMIYWQETVRSENAPVFILMTILMAVCVVAVALSCGASVFYALWRFYRSRFTEEGYLTYTLPVGPHQLLLSSILVSIWDIFLTLLAALCAVVIALGIISLALPWQEIGPEVWARLWEVLGQVLGFLGEHAGELLGALLMVLLMGLSQLMLLMLAVTIGAMAARKHPILMAILVYYLVVILRSISFVLFLRSGTTNVPMSMDLTSLVIAAGSYFLIYYFTTQRRNLT